MAWQMILAGLAAAMTLACGGETASSPNADASSSDAAQDSPFDARDGGAIAALQNPKLLMGTESNSTCNVPIVVELDASRSYTSRVAVCDDNVKLVESDLTSMQLEAVKTALASLPPAGSDCAASARTNMAHVVFFELTRKDGSTVFWWACQDASGAILSPYQELESAMRATIK